MKSQSVVRDMQRNLTPGQTVERVVRGGGGGVRVPAGGRDEREGAGTEESSGR